MKKTKIIQIPFYDGNQLHYPSYTEVNWVDNFEFVDTLILQGYQRGCSAAFFALESETTGKKYTMFLSDMLDVIKCSSIDHGKVNGTWTFCKKGQNYGVRLIAKDE
jgi:hypothetical protein